MLIDEIKEIYKKDYSETEKRLLDAYEIIISMIRSEAREKVGNFNWKIGNVEPDFVEKVSERLLEDNFILNKKENGSKEPILEVSGWAE